MKNKISNKLIIVAATLGLSLSPITIEATGVHVSHSSHVSHTSHVSHSSAKTVKVSSSKPIKSCTKTVKVNKTKTNKSTNNTKKLDLNKKPENKTTTKVDSGKFTSKSKQNNSNKNTSKQQNSNVNKNYKVKVKTTKVIVNKPVRYVSYSTAPVYYNSHSNIWDYYMLSTLINHNDRPSEQDIARELEKQGYNKSETDDILKDIKKENKKPSIWKILFRILEITCILTSIVIIVLWLRSRYKKY